MCKYFELYILNLDSKACEKNFCKNNAKCIANSANSYSCKCLDGYYGQFCESETNECQVVDASGNIRSPCLNNGWKLIKFIT